MVAPVTFYDPSVPSGDDYYGNKVVVHLFPDYFEKEYSVDDFSDIGCVAVYEATKYGNGLDYLRITLSVDSKENVQKVVALLEERPDVYAAYPNYYGKFLQVPNDYNSESYIQWYIEKLDLPEAWDICTGSEEIVVKMQL